ncbi:MAG: peptidyl-prolyl cis-trans isomerase [Ignavibacteriales bacterium]|nr:peptidyl-prolyl cis-trans isomerase [Ignavibacteriales bacterium]
MFLHFLGCNDKPVEEEKIVVKIDKDVLTEDELNKSLMDKKYEKKFREEYIRQWVERELLYREAIESDIIEKIEFQKILDNTKKEIANSFFLKNYFAEKKIELSEIELKQYFEKNKMDFAFSEEIYALNLVQFIDEIVAIDYRVFFIDKGWKQFKNQIKSDTNIYFNGENILLAPHQIQPVELLNAIRALNPGEVSIVIESEPNIFTIVQLIQFYEKGKIPDYDLVSSQVRERYQAEKKQKFYKDLIEDLYIKYNVEIK